MKDKLSKYFIFFMLYAIIGWCYEVFLEVIVYKWGFTNRGVLFGPYCPVYGFGALAFIFTVYPLIKNKKGLEKYLMIPIVFLLCMVIATTIELITSYICEFTMEAGHGKHIVAINTIFKQELLFHLLLDLD